MAPRERTGFSLLWKFVPIIAGTDRSVHWRWQAFTQSGKLFTSSALDFETLTECKEDAKKHGYRRPD